MINTHEQSDVATTIVTEWIHECGALCRVVISPFVCRSPSTTENSRLEPEFRISELKNWLRDPDVCWIIDGVTGDDIAWICDDGNEDEYQEALKLAVDHAFLDAELMAPGIDSGWQP